MKRFTWLALVIGLWFALPTIQLPNSGKEHYSFPELNWLSGVPAHATYTPSVIKSIQYGSCNSTASSSATCNVTLSTAVIMSATVIIPLGATYDNNGDVNPASTTTLGTWELTSTTNVTGTTYAYFNPTRVNQIMALEFSKAFLTTTGVQRGLINLSGDTSDTGTLSPAVVVAKSALIPCGFHTDSTNATNAAEYDSVKYVLTNTTTVTVSRISSETGTEDACWQVAEFK